jgi:N utilization substance protein B
MGVRREGREAAVQFMYLRDLNEAGDLGAFYTMRGISPSARRFCDEILRGVESHRGPIDTAIQQAAQNYELSRISAVDRNVLRVAVYEMLACPDVPPVVSINEAIEIAKKYSTDESGRFVNGVLDRIRSTLPRPARSPKD